MAELLISDVRPWGGSSTDLLVRDGRIVAGEPGPAATRIDGGGRLAFPAMVDAHAHLDKTTWGCAYRPHSAGGSLASLVDNERANRGRLGADVATRAGALLDRYVQRGVLYVRSHVDVDTEAGPDSVVGVLAAAAGRPVHLEVVAFPQSGMLIRPGTDRLLAEAIDAGAHLVGGIDPAGFDGDPIRHLDTIFGIAAGKGVGLDIHLHDRGTLGAWEVERIVERTHAHGLVGRVTIAHCFALSTVDDLRQGQLVELLAGADIALTTVAPGGTAPLPMARLAAAGIRVGVGHDGVRDLWSPYGTGDLMEKIWLLAYLSGARRDDDVEAAWRIGTEGGAAVLGLADYGLNPGSAANLFLIPGATPTEALMDRGSDRLVIAAGRVVT
ncbi:MAG TPA: amidohydrolase [Micromonosporaceae bacterium]|nr:amidohydrolase [Micromonosporaceae bacterium]